MPAGRPAKPTRLHLLDGTFRKDRHAERADAEPQLDQLAKLPKCPGFLRGAGRAEWKRVGQELLDKRVLASADMAAFAGYCASLERAVEAEEVLREQGYTLETPQGFEQARPEVSIARQAWAEVRKFAQEFGITPSARTRVRAVPDPNAEKKKAADPWDEVMNG